MSDPTDPAQQRGRLLSVNRRSAARSSASSPARPQPGQRQRRVGALVDRPGAGRRQVLEQERERRVDRRYVDHVVVVEDEQVVVAGSAGQLVEERGQHPLDGHGRGLQQLQRGRSMGRQGGLERGASRRPRKRSPDRRPWRPARPSPRPRAGGRQPRGDERRLATSRRRRDQRQARLESPLQAGLRRGRPTSPARGRGTNSLVSRSGAGITSILWGCRADGRHTGPGTDGPRTRAPAAATVAIDEAVRPKAPCRAAGRRGGRLGVVVRGRRRSPAAGGTARGHLPSRPRDRQRHPGELHLDEGRLGDRARRTSGSGAVSGRGRPDAATPQGPQRSAGCASSTAAGWSRSTAAASDGSCT